MTANMTEWQPLSATVGASSCVVVLPPLPSIKRATFTAGLATSPESGWLAPSLAGAVTVRDGKLTAVALPSSAIRNHFPTGGACWLLVRAATGVLVARARLTLSP